MITYELALYTIGLCAIPKLFYERIRYGKYKNFFQKRTGIAFKGIERGSKPLIWIHTVSVGETRAIAPLAKKLYDSPLKPDILITNITDTGHEEAKRSLPFAFCHRLMPLDFSWIIRPIVRKLRPDIVILCETDFWFNFLDESKKNGAKIFLTNGKMSEKSFNRFKLFPKFSRRLLSFFDEAYVQSEEYAQRFEELGLPKERITVAGNIKLDTVVPKEDPEFLKDFIGSAPLLVAGSTHRGEEEIILKTYKKLKQDHPQLKLVIVPRHPERFDDVAALIQSNGLSMMRYSSNQDPSAQVCLVDKMGLLNFCYAKAKIAIVCGSFVPGIGGHNIFEPAYYKKPLLFGPYMHNQNDFVALLASKKAGIQTSSDQLIDEVDRLLKSPQECAERGENAFSILHNSQGATQKTYESLISHCS
ncbi:MAG: 3-deoxy-D-manno-octulosonic acid transferase [Parachlamydiaceae bacterium]